MSQTSSENHKVLVLGAGYVSYPLIDYITNHNDTAVTVGKMRERFLKIVYRRSACCAFILYVCVKQLALCSSAFAPFPRHSSLSFVVDLVAIFLSLHESCVDFS